MGKKMKYAVDKLVEKLVSRKFLAWGMATGLMLADKLTSEDWVLVTAIYIGGVGVIDMVQVWKHGKPQQ